MKIIRILLSMLLFAGAALAASLPALVPTGAVTGLYARNLAIKKAFLIDFQIELKRQQLTLDDLINEFANDAPSDLSEIRPLLKLMSIDLVGQEGLAVAYPDGTFLALARPSPKDRSRIFETVKTLLKDAQKEGAWTVKHYPSESGSAIVAGYSQDTLLVASEPAFERFLDPSSPKGLSLPLGGDLVYFLDLEPLGPMLSSVFEGEGLPPSLLKAIQTPRRYAFSLSIEKAGIVSKSEFAFAPEGDRALKALFLNHGRPWPLAALPQGISVTSLYLPLPQLGEYLSNLLGQSGMGLQIDLSAFGNRLALINVEGQSNTAVMAMQNPAGDLLVILEASDALTAEANLLAWLQMAAASATPEGSGGFALRQTTIAGQTAKAVQVGMMGEVYLFNLGDRVALATSKTAAEALFGPRLGENPEFRAKADFYPDTALQLSFSDNRRAWKLAAEQLLATTPMLAQNGESLQKTMRFMQRLSAFLSFVAERSGASLSYTRAQDNTLVTEGLTEVRW